MNMTIQMQSVALAVALLEDSGATVIGITVSMFGEARVQLASDSVSDQVRKHLINVQTFEKRSTANFEFDPFDPDIIVTWCR